MTFDPSDARSMLGLMERFPGRTGSGKNTNGEEILIAIESDEIAVTTFQHNHRLRVNRYYPDGTSEETFEGSWS